MKITKVRLNNRKRVFVVSAGARHFEFPFSRLDHPPTASNRIVEAAIDPELGNEAFTYRLASGVEDSIHLDRVREYNRDPDYLRRRILFELTVKARRIFADGGPAKREVIRRLRTSPAQLYRLLDQTNYRKSIDEMIRLLSALDCRVRLTFDAKAA